MVFLFSTWFYLWFVLLCCLAAFTRTPFCFCFVYCRVIHGSQRILDHTLTHTFFLNDTVSTTTIWYQTVYTFTHCWMDVRKSLTKSNHRLTELDTKIIHTRSEYVLLFIRNWNPFELANISNESPVLRSTVAKFSFRFFCYGINYYLLAW